ncbi:hypothetical protein ACWM35_21450 [Neobacillus sp. K501]
MLNETLVEEQISVETEVVENERNELERKKQQVLILNQFLEKSILKVKYIPSPKYNETIILNEKGQKIYEDLKSQFSILDDTYNSEIKLSLMLTSVENINMEKLNLGKLKEIISEEIINKKLLFPYLYGRELYNKFHELFNNNDLLNAEETTKLLNDSPIGVFQFGNFLIGPFGILESRQTRAMPPSKFREYPLWHCEDVSCLNIHRTKLTSSENIIQNLVEAAAEISTVDEEMSINEIISFNPYDYNRIDELAYLIGSFPDEELRLLLADLINSDKSIRKLFPNRFKDLWKGNGQKISSDLTHNQCFQLILLFKDDEILKKLEDLIFNNKINIPETEIRKGKLMINRRGIFHTETQCSKYGFRSIITMGKEINTALIRLKSLIKKLYYTSSTDKEKLKWKLRSFEGSTLDEILGRYLLTENPREIITNLIFDNPNNVQKTFEYLNCTDFGTLLDPYKEEYFINMILWKLGFDITVFPSYQSLFWKRHDQFLRIIKNNQVFTEDEREAIRSSGVNFFVSLEEILDYALSFITWALLSDHYISDKFTFNLEDARTFTANIVNNHHFKINDNEFLNLDKDGRNTLYPLIKGFSAIAEICEEHLKFKDKYERLETEYPSYYKKTDLYDFPFRYKVLLLDLEKTDVRRIIELLKKISDTLETKNISNVRNRIKHNRPIHEFPSIGELEETCNAISEVVLKMEVEGILPTVYIRSGKENDEFGRGFVKYKNYKGVSILLSNSSQFIRSGMPLYKKVQLILPNVHINNSVDKLRFNYFEKTSYSNYWSEYPKYSKK